MFATTKSAHQDGCPSPGAELGIILCIALKQKLSLWWPMWCSKSKAFDFLQWLSKNPHKTLGWSMECKWSQSFESEGVHGTIISPGGLRTSSVLELFLLTAFLVRWTRWDQRGSKELCAGGRTHVRVAGLSADGFHLRSQTAELLKTGALVCEPSGERNPDHLPVRGRGLLSGGLPSPAPPPRKVLFSRHQG